MKFFSTTKILFLKSITKWEASKNAILNLLHVQIKIEYI